MNIQWEAGKYTENFDFVHRYGESVLELVEAEAGGLVVDLGCGNGALTQKLADRGYRVLGVDDSAEMVAEARALHPGLPFQKGDAVTFQLEEKADVIFSNAVLHWIDGSRQQALARNVAAQLKPGGQFIFEFGGKGCAERVHSSLERQFARRGLAYPRTFYFPTIGEYAPVLERAGFRVEYAVLFDRPTEQKTGDGLADWVRMFVKKPFEGLEPALGDEILRAAVEELRPALFRDGKWFVDYVRIRMKARKTAG